MNLEKTTWEDPILNVQVFAPQEYVANCWYVDPSDMFTTLYEDGRGLQPRDNRYQSAGLIPLLYPDEKWDIPASARLPREGYFTENDPQPEQLATQYYFYTSYNSNNRYNGNREPSVYKLGNYLFRQYRESLHS